MSVDRNATVSTGRVSVPRVCPSCKQRYKIGEPVASDTWPARLSLSPTQLDLLLVAAAEYLQLSSDCRNCYHGAHGDLCISPPAAEICKCREYVPMGDPDVIAFLDWVKPDALSRSYSSPVSLRNGTELR